MFSVTVRKGRGKAKGMEFLKLRKVGRVPVRVPDGSRGPSKDNCLVFASRVTYIVKRFANMRYKCWSLVPKEDKEELYNRVLVFGHGIVHPPPSLMRNTTGELLQNVHIPVAVIVPEAKPRLITKVVDDIKNWRIRPIETSFRLFFLLLITFPEVLQEVHMFGIRCHRVKISWRYPWSPPL
ncbi:hypothetical protein CJ030_MR3G025340 [Morella rubra]|uniref:Uncharacterized protein n=1 Tax=Morella rubra TaxID=262757 RepID=A0A6A1W6R6_9ROSI|nr:hypothetical protein CJ030_MR3G025340 [Morella rubra]